jgi:hypothetical protein
MYTTIKTLQRNFVTDPERWLGQSLYFEKLFSGKWGDKQENGSYFIETDAQIFEHILRYLRTGVLPVFYDRENGRDFTLYQSVLEEAKYFAINRLERWLCERKYLEVVEIHHVATETQDRGSYSKNTTIDSDGCTFMEENRNVEITKSSNVTTTMVPIIQRQSSFYCPNEKHGKSNEAYCRSCIVQARDDKININGGWREEDQLKWCIVRKEVIFNHDLCVNAYLEDDLP